MNKSTKVIRLLAMLLCISLIFNSTQMAVAAGNVLVDIEVCSTLTSSESIAVQTADDEYQVRDAIYALDDSTVNRATSEHFQIIWGNGDTTGTVDYEFVKGNLINLENIRTFYIEELGMKDIGISQNPYKTGLYKTNVYISATGLSEFEDDWAYMSVDADSFGYLFVAPGAMRVDEPSWVIPHELAHVFTYHQGGSIAGAWYEATANWFRDQYLGSEYYAYGGKTYGPTSDFFAPYMINSSYHVPHMLNWYDTWPFLLYISENPDNINGLGMELIHKIFEYTGYNDSMYDLAEELSGVSIKTILGGMTRRLATMDFKRQEHYLNRLNNETLTVDGNYEKIYTTLEEADSEGWQSVPSDRAPMQTGFNIIPLDVDLSKDKLKVEFVDTSGESESDFRTSIVTSTANNYTRYSNMLEGDGTAEIILHGDETNAYLVVCSTPDTIETFYVDWNSQVTDASTRFGYKVKIQAEDVTVEEPTTEEPTVEEATTEESTTEESTTEEVTTEEPTVEETTTEESTTEEPTTEEVPTEEETTTESHVHEFTSVITTKATCTTKGVKTFTCKCGHYYIEEIAMLGHNEVMEEAVAATCTEGGLTAGSHCSRCNEVLVVQKAIPAVGHNIVIKTKAKEATCTEDGCTKETYCARCKETLSTSEVVPALGHNAVTDAAVAATCTTEGKTKGSHCKRCNTVIVAQKTIAALGHNYKTVTTAATMQKDGSIVTKCTRCNSQKSSQVISKIASVTLSKVQFVYNGKIQKPTVVVKDSKGNTITNANYTVKIEGVSKLSGRYTVTITFKNKYSGTVTRKYVIKPKKLNISSIKAETNGFTVKWNQSQAGVTGYQIQYSTDSNFNNAKMVTVQGKSVISKTVKGLTKNKTYYVRVRAFKKATGGNVVSVWSAKKQVKTK